VGVGADAQKVAWRWQLRSFVAEGAPQDDKCFLGVGGIRHRLKPVLLG
jgi:hypothetical protein